MFLIHLFYYRLLVVLDLLLSYQHSLVLQVAAFLDYLVVVSLFLYIDLEVHMVLFGCFFYVLMLGSFLNIISCSMSIIAYLTIIWLNISWFSLSIIWWVI